MGTASTIEVSMFEVSKNSWINMVDIRKFEFFEIGQSLLILHDGTRMLLEHIDAVALQSRVMRCCH